MKPKSCYECPVFEQTKKGCRCKVMPTLKNRGEEKRKMTPTEMYKNCPIGWDEGEKNANKTRK